MPLMTQGPRERPDWRAIGTASAIITLVNLAVLVWATRQGLLAGTAFPNPLGSRLAVYGALNLSFAILPLVIYHYVALLSLRWAALVYLSLVATFALVSIPVLCVFLERRIFVFRAGYSVTWDVTWGVVQYLVLLALYRRLAQKVRATR